MKVLFVSSGNAEGGISPIVKSQGESLRKNGVDLEFFTINGKGFWLYFRHIFILWKFLSAHSYDIVHAHYSLSGYVAAMAGSKPLVVSLMGNEVKDRSYFTFVLKTFIRFFWDATIMKSEDMKSSSGIKKVNVIPNGVDIKKFRPIPNEEALKITNWDNSKRHILFAARTNRYEKNFKLADEAFKLLSVDDVELHANGNIPNDLMPYYLNAADTVLLTSFWEGSPNIIKEAMSCNRPLVTTGVGDVFYVTGNTKGCNISGFSPTDVANKIKESLKFAKSGTNGRERIMELRLDSDSVAKRIISLYKSVLLNKSSRTNVRDLRHN